MRATVCDENMCTGCMACVNSCPQKAITLEDSLCSFNARINSDKCINCRRCEIICPNNHPVELLNPIFWTQGWATDKAIRERGSSGGFAGAITTAFIKNGGYVCSCTYADGKFEFETISTVDGISRFSGSKYIKSCMGDAYKDILCEIRKGHKVLYIGLPCQVAGVKKYVGNSDKLYTVDLICHGTPSPQLLKDYLAQDFNISLNQEKDIKFRTKHSFRITVANKPVVPPRVAEKYSSSFLAGITYTANCYQCRYAQIKRCADLTLGDSWGTQLSREEQIKGISLALCQTMKGRELINAADLECFEVDIENAIKANHQLEKPSAIPDAREVFFKHYCRTRNFGKAISATRPYYYFKQYIKLLLVRLHMLR